MKDLPLRFSEINLQYRNLGMHFTFPSFRHIELIWKHKYMFAHPKICPQVNIWVDFEHLQELAN